MQNWHPAASFEAGLRRPPGPHGLARVADFPALESSICAGELVGVEEGRRRGPTRQDAGVYAPRRLIHRVAGAQFCGGPFPFFADLREAHAAQLEFVAEAPQDGRLG